MKEKLGLIQVVLLLTLTLMACGGIPKKWPAVTGEAFDETTGEPLSGAHVIATWEGRGGGYVHSQLVCYHAEGAVTNNLGEFSIPAFDESAADTFLADRYVSYYAFKVGYERGRVNIYDGMYSNTAFFKPFTGTSNQRFEFYKEFVMSASCGSAEHSLRNAYPLYEALYYEAKGLAETEEQKQDVDWLRYVAAWAWVSPPSSGDSDKREKEIQLFLKDNLK